MPDLKQHSSTPRFEFFYLFPLGDVTSSREVIMLATYLTVSKGTQRHT